MPRKFMEIVIFKLILEGRINVSQVKKLEWAVLSSMSKLQKRWRK